MCYAKNEWGTATSNSVFVRAAILNNFKEQPPITKTVEEGKPFKLPCEAPDGWPKPNIYWMIQVREYRQVARENQTGKQTGKQTAKTKHLLDDTGEIIET